MDKLGESPPLFKKNESLLHKEGFLMLFMISRIFLSIHRVFFINFQKII